MFGLWPQDGPRIETARLVLRPPRFSDHAAWAAARRASRAFLSPWEPTWSSDHFSPAAFRQRVRWARRAIRDERAWPFFLIRTEDAALLGAITLDNVRRGPAEAGTVGYWIAAAEARRGYMLEALLALRRFAFDEIGLSRLEAGCLPENRASRALLEKAGFAEEGRAEAYLRIDGRWRDHALYAALRPDRRAGAALRPAAE